MDALEFRRVDDGVELGEVVGHLENEFILGRRGEEGQAGSQSKEKPLHRNISLRSMVCSISADPGISKTRLPGVLS